MTKNNSIPLNEEQYHYLYHVMRLKPDDKLLCFNGVDGEWEASIDAQGKKKWYVIPQKQTRFQNVTPFCALCPALIKKDNFDLVLQKATELNVSDIYPLKLDRSVVATLNMKRAESILIEASEQCERLDLPRLHPVMNLKDFLKNLPKDVTLFYLSERENNVSQTISCQKPAFVVGPEGGFTPEELTILSQHKAYMIHFPETILRAETASIATISCWQFGQFIPNKK
ncbi:MAG: 16S rRNA (uracil(1498)-N(3))-methyltransferase [Alphaproteobacteria bacterium]|nr:16S rRNA (uracil(1498)-N(3))-methyltransferase [Alphaproteobacteria bacterium]